MYTVGLLVLVTLVGVCRSQPPSTCVSDSTCRDGQTCQMGACMPDRRRQNRRTCVSDTDCGRNRACRAPMGCEGDCDMSCVRVRNCTVDADCRAGQTCRFRRVPGCRGRHCEREQVCRRGPKICEKDEDCEEDEDCIVRACQGADCSPGGLCIKEGNPGSRICDTDADCDEGLLCIPHPRDDCDGPTCKPVTVCRRGTTCLRKHRRAMGAFRNSDPRVVFVPRCDLRGRWQAVQCLDQLGVCWCVDVNRGTRTSDPIKGQPRCNDPSSTPTPDSPQLCGPGQEVRVCPPTVCLEQLLTGNHSCRIDPCNGCRAVYLDGNNQEVTNGAASRCAATITQTYRSAITKLKTTNNKLFMCVIMTMYDDITLGYSNGLQVPAPDALLDVMEAAVTSCATCLALGRPPMGRGPMGSGVIGRRVIGRGDASTASDMDDDDDDSSASTGASQDSQMSGDKSMGPMGRPMGRPGQDPLGQVRMLWETFSRLNTQLNVSKDTVISLMVTELAAANALLRAGRCPTPGPSTPGGEDCTRDDDTTCGTGIRKCCPDGTGGHVCMDPLHIIIPKVFTECRADGTGGGYQYKQCFSTSPRYCACVNEFGELRAETVREGGTLRCDQNGITFEEDTKPVTCSRDAAPSACSDLCLQPVACEKSAGIPLCVVDICNRCNVSYIKTPSFGGFVYFPTRKLLPSPDGLGPVLSYPGGANLRAMLTRLLDIVILTSQSHDDVDDDDSQDDGSVSSASSTSDETSPLRRRRTALPLVDDELVTSVAWFQKGARLVLDRLSRSALPDAARRGLGVLSGLLPGRPSLGTRRRAGDRAGPAPNMTALRQLTCKALPPVASSCDLTNDRSVCDQFRTMEECIRHCRGLLCKENTAVRVCETYNCSSTDTCGAYPDLRKDRCIIDPCTCQPVFITWNGTAADCSGPPRGLCARFKAVSQSGVRRRLPRLTCSPGPGGPGQGPVGQGPRSTAQGPRPTARGQRPAGQAPRPAGPRPRPAGQGQRPVGLRPRPAGQGQGSGTSQEPSVRGRRTRPVGVGEIWQRQSLPIDVDDVRCDGDDFAVKQCGSSECVCVDPLNQPVKGKRGGPDLVCDRMVLDRADFVIRFIGSLNRIVDRPRFKKIVAMEMAKYLNLGEKGRVSITEVKSGSIVTVGHISGVDVIRAVGLAQIFDRDGLMVMYDNERLVAPPGQSEMNLTFTADQVAGATSPAQPTTTTPAMTSETDDKETKRKTKLLIIIVVCVLVGLIIIIVGSVLCALRLKKNKQSTGDEGGKNMGFKNSGYDSQIDEKSPI